MSMLDMLEKEFVKRNLTEGNTPELVKAIANSIPSTNIPYRMKLAIAYNELVIFFSQFRINIDHWYGSSIPINAITFCLAKSGAAKDSSVNLCRKCFASGYELIENYRKKKAKESAIALATAAGVDLPDRWIGYKNYYKEPNPLFISITTPEGFLQHLVDLGKDICGSGVLSISELGSEMASNVNFNETIKLISELYDEGNKNAKMLKSKELQTKAIKNFPVSAIILGAVSNILYDSNIKQKFKIEFTSKLARRSFFIFVNEDILQEEEKSIEDLIREDKEKEEKAIKARNDVSNFIKDLTPQFFSRMAPKSLKVSPEVQDLFHFYKRYNEAQSQIIAERLPITKLSRAHMQWKALKLAGALALACGSPSIEEADYRAAIEYAELIADDIHNFELELTKENYELFCAYVHEYEIQGKFQITLHELRKSGFLFKGLSATSMKELTKYANSYDNTGEYKYDSKNDLVTYQRTDNSKKILVSYMECKGTKAERKKKCATGFMCIESTFKDLQGLLEGDYAYTCFKFANGIRGKDNIISGTKWIILDVDDTECTDEEAHILLSEYNHYICRTSDSAINTKYRILLELDQEINVSDYYWTQFIEIVALDLGFVIDRLAKAQIFFSYAESGKYVLSQLEGMSLEVEKYLKRLKKYDDNFGTYVKKKSIDYSDIEKHNMLNDPLTTFSFAYEAKQGYGRVSLIRTARLCRDLGATKEYTLKLIEHIAGKYWVKPLDEYSLNVMLKQISRWEGFNESKDTE